MNHLKIEELEYFPDSTAMFQSLLDLELPVYLDSSNPYSSIGRYDIFTAAPVKRLEKKAINHYKSDYYKTNDKYFSNIRNSLNEIMPCINNDYHLPFIGGAIGYFGYDLGRENEQLLNNKQNDFSLPIAVTGIYSWAVIVDHRQQQTLLVAHPIAKKELINDIRLRLKTSRSKPAKLDPFSLTTSFTPNMSKQHYAKAFDAIQQYIDAGDCYQINLAQRFSAHFSGHSWEAYKALRSVAAAPYSAYMQINDKAVLSLSPERFLQVNNQRVTTSPIKGTIARSDEKLLDDLLAQQLLSSSKDRAENLMIVDLLRNDLGRCCIAGSIQVDELFQLQSFATVHHLVSTISGQLPPNQDPLELLAKCFPGGSITGAPKVRAMQIIEELELHRRSAYCGSIGYISCDGQMDTNISIRTLVCDDSSIYCWAGGAIVADSECESEYQECFTKVSKLLTTLEAF